MRPFARQSAWLANNSRVRQSSIPRNAQGERHFRTSAAVASDSRRPNGSSDDRASFNERREEQKKTDSAAVKSEEAEKENGDGRNDQRRPGSKRWLRNNRVNDVPKPPPIPDWFLKHNVKLLKDSPGMTVGGERGQVIRCVDAESGHTLFEVPFYEAWPAQPDANQKHRKGSLQKDFFDQRVKFEEKQEKKEPQEFKLDVQDSADEWKNNQLRWAFLEAETSIRAAFSLPPENQRSYSLLANRVDLSLQCPDLNSTDRLDEFVRDLARVVQADLVRLDANDLAELANEYVDMGHDGPGTFSNLGYDVFRDLSSTPLLPKPVVGPRPFEDEENDMDEEEAEEDEHDDVEAEADRGSRGPPFAIGDIRRALMGQGPGRSGHRVVGISINVPRSLSNGSWFAPQSGYQSRSIPDSSRDDTPRLVALLESLVDAPKHKPASVSHGDARKTDRWKAGPQTKSADEPGRDYQRILRHWRAHPSLWMPQVARSLVSYLSEASQKATESAKSAFKLTSLTNGKDTALPQNSGRRTIIHVRDLRDIANARAGDWIIQQLCKVVQKRRRTGEQIVVVGTTAQDAIGPIEFPGDVQSMNDFPLRSMTIPPLFNLSMSEVQQLEASSPSLPSARLDRPENRRILEINVRHLQSMLRKLRPGDSVDLVAEGQGQLNLPGMHFLTEKVLPLEHVQRLVLTAIGLSQVHTRSNNVQPIHLALAAFVATRSDNAVKAWFAFNENKLAKKIRGSRDKASVSEDSPAQSSEARMNRLKKECNSHETRLLSGMVDPANIKTTFSEVHAQVETINALKDLTTLSLLRPEAFKYGVLANDRLPGLLLYGPPGTGKTLLAKAVAKESKATVLEVSGAQIYEKYVGEGEKMVRAVFSLAKKLSPCVVFIDEADAIFGSRSNNGGNRNTHREIINQFLREWDGMDDHGVFMMVASNRPFDLDDAVLRRLPRRLLVDLPVAQDRESILGIHLRNETLDPSVSLAQLAEQTPLYSGSDLKNLSVAAALACVREENDLIAQHGDDKEFKLPEKRTLLPRHFDKALAEISASISEDMSSLTAIRKFDEQYGDRKGRRKKPTYGFGLGDGTVDESAVRVRSGLGPPGP